MILGFGVPILTLNGIGLMFFSSTIYGGEHSMSIAGIYVILIITIAIVYFLIGAFLGWVYGKIKNRKVKNI